MDDDPNLIMRIVHGVTTFWRAISSPKDLTAEESASTLFRVFRSKHVADLRLIFWLIVILAILILAIALLIAIWDYHHELQYTESLVKLVGAVLGATSLIAAWAYRSASTRLGVVDLFAAEIGTLCRAGTVVNIAKYYIEMYKASPVPKPGAAQDKDKKDFVSQEDYFPIFDKNANDLQILEANVVTHISEFYTYMKATRDTQRALMPIEPSAPDPSSTEPTPWCAAVANVIFMLFLGYESARKAIDDLIEYEPNAAETKMVILVTELSCYAFLCEFFQKDQLRSARLGLREPEYKQVAPKLYQRVSAHEKDKDWQRAVQTLQALADKYKNAFGEKISGPRAPPASSPASSAILQEPGLV